MAFRGEIFVSRALRTPKLRGCPICLRLDAEAHGGAPRDAMAFRGDWQLREVSICVRHRHPLVELWEVGPPAHRYNFSERFAEICPDILQGRLDRPAMEPSGYDLWLDRRLEDGRDDTWLSNHSIYAATTFLRLFDVELLRLDRPARLDPAAQIRGAQAKAFEIARHGEAAIASAQDDLAVLAPGALDEPAKAFGILEIWPIAAGESVLGDVLQARKLHSVAQAAREAGVGSALLEQFLLEAGAIALNDARPMARKTFDAQRYAALMPIYMLFDIETPTQRRLLMLQINILMKPPTF